MTINKTFKITLVLLLALALCLSSVACGGKKDDGNIPETDASGFPKYPEIDFASLDTSKYLTLGQYKGLTIEILKKSEITDADVIKKINSDLISSKYTVKVTDRAVTKEDTVCITFVGYADGVAFQGGSGTEDYFTVYDGGKFIDGFADGIIGAMPGVETDVNVTFPENYHNASMAGKPAVFKVTVNHIYEAAELTDEIANDLTKGEHKTAESMYNYYKNRLTEENDLIYEEEKSDKVWSRIFNGVTNVKLPSDIVEKIYNYEIAVSEFYANAYGMTADDFLTTYRKHTRESLRKEIENNLLTDLVIYAVMRAEGIKLTDEDYNNYIKQSGITEEEWLKDYSSAELRDMMVYTKTYDSAASWQTFVEIEPSIK